MLTEAVKNGTKEKEKKSNSVIKLLYFHNKRELIIFSNYKFFNLMIIHEEKMLKIKL